VFRNPGIYNSNTEELPRRKHTTFRTRRKFEINNKLWFTKPHCDGQVKDDEMEVACNTPDKDAKVGKHEGKAHWRRTLSRRVVTLTLILLMWRIG
jgi:hypothetical protein